MKNFSNTYIFIFSAIMVVIVAAILSFISMQLKPVQQRNIKIEQIQSILSAVNVESTVKNAEEKFKEYIVESYVVNSQGEVIKGLGVFDVDMKKELKKIQDVKSAKEAMGTGKVSPIKKFLSGFISFKKIDQNKINKKVKDLTDSRKLPVFVCKKEGKTYYVFPLRGKGLWGPIWGYISLEDDFNTVYGANYDHKTETPGLGAEIKENWFEKQFQGKKIFDQGKFVSIEVVKGGTDDSNPHGVDAISGGTITSKGLESMLFDCLSSYSNFFNIKTKSDE